MHKKDSVRASVLKGRKKGLETAVLCGCEDWVEIE